MVRFVPCLPPTGRWGSISSRSTWPRSASRTAPPRICWRGPREQFGSRMVLTCSWQKQSSILVHLLAQVAPRRASSRSTRACSSTSRTTPAASSPSATASRSRRSGPRRTSPSRPPSTARASGSATPTSAARCARSSRSRSRSRAPRRGSAACAATSPPTRRGIRKVQLDEKRGVVKIQPLADWTDRDCWRFIVEHAIPYNALHDRNYPSVGCTPCTRAVLPGEDERAGRWAAPARPSAAFTVDASALAPPLTR